MNEILIFNKPFRVMCQFSAAEGRKTLADYINIPGIYPAGRLDYDSEGLMLLTGDGKVQHWISDPRHKMVKTYWAQVEGEIDDAALMRLRQGLTLNDGPTLPAGARRIPAPAALWPRDPPIRQRAAIPTSWLELQISEGRNRQVRRMTAAAGFPTLRLIRAAIGDWSLGDLAPGDSRWQAIQPPPRIAQPRRRKSPARRGRP